MREKIYNVIKDLQRGNVNYSDAVGKLCDLHSVSGCLICIMDNVEGDGLTKGIRYKILAEKDGMYCIVDDNSKLGVYGEIFFDKE